MKRIKAVIIDDGIHTHFDSVKEKWMIDADGQIIRQREFSSDELPSRHGDTCMKIIEKYADMQCVDFYSILVLNPETGKGNANNLLHALDFCLRLDVKLIHMSLGSSTYTDFESIRGRVDLLSEKGAIVVAACNNCDTVTYPAYLNNVIAVKCAFDLIDDKYRYIRNAFNHVNFEASSRHFIKENALHQLTSQTNSFAAPVITAKVLNVLSVYPSATAYDVMKALLKNATNPELSFYCGKLPFVEKHLGKNALMNVYHAKPGISNETQKIKGLCVCTNLHSVASHELAEKTNELLRCGYKNIIINVKNDTIDLKPFLHQIDSAENQNVLVYHPKDTKCLRIEQTNKNICFYEEANYETIRLIRPGITVPIIAFYGFHFYELIQMFQMLNRMFAGDGYDAKLSVDTIEADLFEIDVIPKLTSLDKYLTIANSYFNPDVFLLGFLGKEFLGTGIEYDLIVLSSTCFVNPIEKDSNMQQKVIWADSDLCSDCYKQIVRNLT